MATITDDIFNRHIYKDEVINIKAKEAKDGDVLVIQQRAYQIKKAIPQPPGNIIFDFKQGVMLICKEEAIQQKFIND